MLTLVTESAILIILLFVRKLKKCKLLSLFHGGFVLIGSNCEWGYNRGAVAWAKAQLQKRPTSVGLYWWSPPKHQLLYCGRGPDNPNTQLWGVSSTSAATLDTAHYIPHCTLYSIQDTILYTAHYISHSTLYYTQHTIFYTAHYILHSTLYSTQHTIFYTAQYILHNTIYSTQHTIFYTEHYILQCTPHYSQHSISYNTDYILHRTLYSIHHTIFYTIHYNIHCTLNFILYSRQDSLLFTALYFRHHTIFYTAHYIHCIHQILYSTLHTPNTIFYTAHHILQIPPWFKLNTILFSSHCIL